MNHIKVSVITICLNSVETIEQTIQSVISQAYDNIEYIIIDGGSTDGTLDVIRKYEKNITYWVSEPDRGIFDAMNKGIARVTGDIVGIINSTDWYAKDAIRIVAQFFSDNPETELIHGYLMEITDDGAERLYRGIDPKSESAGEVYPHPTVFLRRALYERFGVFQADKYPLMADMALMLKLKQKKVVIHKIPEVIAYFRLGGVSNSAGTRWKRSAEVRRIADELINYPHTSLQEKQELLAARDKYLLHELFQYALERIKKDKILKEVLFNILSWSEKKKYVIWGCGDDGKQLYECFGNYTSMIDCFVDRNKNMTGTLHSGKLINDVSYISREEHFVIISTRRFEKQIKTILVHEGYEWGKDYMSYNDFQYNVIFGAFPKLFTTAGNKKFRTIGNDL